VAALLADIAAANSARRIALVGAGRGVVVDWLLEIVSRHGNGNGDRGGAQSEAARALAHLVADPAICEKVLGRPGAVPSLLRFIFSFQPKKHKKVDHCWSCNSWIYPGAIIENSSFGSWSHLSGQLPCCYAIYNSW
jgi:protein SERAC1